MKKGVATYISFITSCKLSTTILFIYNKSGYFSIMKKICTVGSTKSLLQ